MASLWQSRVICQGKSRPPAGQSHVPRERCVPSCFAWAPTFRPDRPASRACRSSLSGQNRGICGEECLRGERSAYSKYWVQNFWQISWNSHLRQCRRGSCWEAGSSDCLRFVRPSCSRACFEQEKDRSPSMMPTRSGSCSAFRVRIDPRLVIWVRSDSSTAAS